MQRRVRQRTKHSAAVVSLDGVVLSPSQLSLRVKGRILHVRRLDVNFSHGWFCFKTWRHAFTVLSFIRNGENVRLQNPDAYVGLASPEAVAELRRSVEQLGLVGYCWTRTPDVVRCWSARDGSVGGDAAACARLKSWAETAGGDEAAGEGFVAGRGPTTTVPAEV